MKLGLFSPLLQRRIQGCWNIEDGTLCDISQQQKQLTIITKHSIVDVLDVAAALDPPLPSSLFPNIYSICLAIIGLINWRGFKECIKHLNFLTSVTGTNMFYRKPSIFQIAVYVINLYILYFLRLLRVFQVPFYQLAKKTPEVNRNNNLTTLEIAIW